MKTPFMNMAARFVLVIGLALSLHSAAFAVASLTDWVGVNNTAGANSYSVTSPTTAGGTFAERQAAAASLSDQSVGGAPFDWSTPLSMSGTITYNASTFDPVMFLGWYNSANLNQRIGIGVADPIPAGTGIRWQTQSGNVSGTTVVSQNFAGSTTASTFAPNTYTFTFNYDGIGHMSGAFGSLNFARNYALPTDSNLHLDRFGFLQKSAADDNAHTFTLNVSDLNYTGDTQYVPGSTLGDFNSDGKVDAGDYATWRKNDGTNNALPNDNGLGTPVGPLHYGLWRANFGNPPGSGSLGEGFVPEPSSLLLAIAAFALAGTKRARSMSNR